MAGRSSEIMADEATNERLGSDFDRGYETKALDFTKVDFTTFKSEYTWKDDNVVYHFWMPDKFERMMAEEWADRAHMDRRTYWNDLFPNCLSEVAEDHFNASFPRLKAAYTEELKSWWMQADNYQVMERVKFAESFLEKLDKRLEEEIRKGAPT